MRFQQIIADVARSLVIAGAREVKSVGTFVRVSDLHLCMASVSTGTGTCPSSPPTMYSWQHHENWNLPTDVPAAKAIGSKRKRLLSERLISLAGFGPKALHCRDC